MPLLLELFKGTGSAGKVFKKHGYKVLSHDIMGKYNPSITGNILDLNPADLPVPDVIWASPPCNSFSNLAYSAKLRDASTMRPTHPTGVLGDKILAKTVNIIKYLKKKNPKLKFIIENPHGTMWRSPILRRLPHSTAFTHYELYGDNRRKPTDFFNNFNLELKQPTYPLPQYRVGPKDYSNPEKGVLPKYKLVDRCSLADRYRIPSKLIHHVVRQI